MLSSWCKTQGKLYPVTESISYLQFSNVFMNKARSPLAISHPTYVSLTNFILHHVSFRNSLDMNSKVLNNTFESNEVDVGRQVTSFSSASLFQEEKQG